MRRWGFDLDGVLAESPPASPKKWGYMKGAEREARLQELLFHYSRARVLFRPRAAKFFVISARKDNPEVRGVTEQWLRGVFGAQAEQVYLLQKARSLPNVIAFKGRVIRALRLTDFAEDNVAVVKGLRAACPETHVWLFEGGQLKADPAKAPRS